MLQSHVRSLSIISLLFAVLSACSGAKVTEYEIDEKEISETLNSFDVLVSSKVDVPQASSAVASYLTFAVQSSPEVAALRQAEIAASNNVEIAKSKSRSQVDVSSTVGAYQADVSSGGFTEGASISLTMSKNLFDGGATTGSVRYAGLQLALAKVVTEKAVNRVSAEASRAFLTLLLADRQLSLIQDFHEEVKPQLGQLTLMAQSGLIDRSVLDEIDSRLLEIDGAEQEAKTDLIVAKLDFEKYFHQVEVPSIDFSLPEEIERKLSKGFISNNTPLGREAALNVLLAEQNVQIVQAGFSPNVSARLGSSSPMDPSESASAQVGILVNYKIGDGGAREANLAQAEANLTRVKRTSELTVENTQKSLSALIERTNALNNLLILADKKLRALVDQLEVAEKQIQTGQADVAKVFGIKLKLNEQKSRILLRRSELYKAKIEMASTLGLFSE